MKTKGIAIPLALKLALGFGLVIMVTSVLSLAVGIWLINDRVLAEAEEKVRYNLNAAREIYANELARVDYVVSLTAERFFLRDALLNRDIAPTVTELARIKRRERLDILTVTDKDGRVLLRLSDSDFVGDDQSGDEIVGAVLQRATPVAATVIVSGEALRRESPFLAEQAHIVFIDTPHARPRPETEETAGMMLKAAAPIFDYHNNLIGVFYGGILLNRNYTIVDKVKQTVFQDLVYKGKDIGTATIFQDDVRISTNVTNAEGSRAIGTRVAKEVYDQVVGRGQPRIGRAYVVNNWYITAYEPIRNSREHIIGILYVGILEEKYLDIRRQTILTFLGITLAGMLITLVVAYFLSRRILGSLHKLATVAQEVARGNLDVQAEIGAHDELQILANAFNSMAVALKRRDVQLKEFATRKIMESERLALVGQLAANVAHELNNPLQGVVAYAHLLLEKVPADDPTRNSLEKIASQANRCREIIRGLLDFSRQRKPDKTLTDVNALLGNCIDLVKNQALFQNIHVHQDLQADLPLIVVDPSLIERVFMNLIINAAEAMDGNGQLILATCFEPATGFIEISFVDTGHGISAENIDRIFDPFFTTKDVGHGTGLGLAISYGIIQSHKGTITVESEVGQGATFRVRLPISGWGESETGVCMQNGE